MTRRKIFVIAGLLLLAIGSTVDSPAQQAQRQPTPNDALKSPEPLADGRVVFRIYAPKASEVTVGGDWIAQGLGAGGKLAKDEQGVWSITIGPLPADFYSYSLIVDGVRTLDPENPMIKQGFLENFFFVPGDAAAFQDNQVVPHGEVRKVWYQSTTLGAQRRLHVYTPPGYDSSRVKYPVFYLLHGGGAEDSGWSTIGRAGFILDNLIAAKKARPMIVVMPDGNVPPPPGYPVDPAARAVFQERFASELLKDIVPFVEKNFHVSTGSANRALAGFSSGGGQTLRTVALYPDQFGYVGVWSNGVGVSTAATADFEKRNEGFLKNPSRVNNGIRIFEIICGEKDTLALGGSKNLDEILTRYNIRHELRLSAGGHTWINWRRYLNEFAPRLFRTVAE